ncbi:MAG TPA: Mov34/MPN/PAD-1 family protein, partial [Myxococcaceae bacterium]
MLTESQIQRYARQLLLRDVGERGQEALGAVLVELALPDEVAAAAAAYLRAGGTEVHGPAMSGSPWAPTPPLLESSPPRRLDVVAAPAVPEKSGVIVGSDAGRVVLWSLGETGCRACLLDGARGLAPPVVGAGVQLGSLIALLVQRRALGLAAPIEGLEVSSGGETSTLAPRPCPHRPPVVPEAVLRALLAHLTSALPDEGCAVLVGREDQVRLVPMQNAQAIHHARDPAAFPRTARTAFSLEPRAWLGLLREADRTGERVLAVAHSHPDGGTHFSGEDRRCAAPDGQPLLPGVAHLVVAFSGGRPRTARWALWSDGDFLEIDYPLPGGS